MLGALDVVGHSIARTMRATTPNELITRTQQISGGALTSGTAVMPSGSAPPRRGQRQFLREYNNMPWLRAISSRVAFDVASTSWCLYALRSGPGERFMRPRAIQRASFDTRRAMLLRAADHGNLTEIEQHPMLDLINDPCPLLEGVSARKVTQEWVDIAGAGHWILENDTARNSPTAGQPIHGWPLPPHWILDYPTAQRPTYMVNLPGGQAEVPMADVLSFVDIDPYSPYDQRGAGIFYATADELEIDEYAAKHAKGVFYNRARPDILVTVPGASRPELQRYERDWLAKARGVFNTWLPMFNSREVTVKELSQTFQSLDFTNLRTNERNIIMQVIGMPPEVMGVIENSNRSTIDAADYLYGRHVLIPRLELMRSVFQERLAGRYDDRIVVDYHSPIAEDKEYALKVAVGAPWSRTVDEWRRMGGSDLEEIPGDGGKVYMIPFTLAARKSPGDATAAVVKPPAPLPGAATPADPNADPAADPAAASASRFVTRDVDPRIAPVLMLADNLGVDMANSYEATVLAHAERIDEAALVGAITSGLVEVAIAAADPDGLSVALWGPRYGASPFEAQDGELLRLLAQALQGGAEIAAEQLVAAGLAIVFDTANPYAMAWADAHAAELVRQVSAGQRDVIRAIIENGIEARETPIDIARQVRAVVGLTDRQAATVASYRRGLISEGASPAEVERLTSSFAGKVLRNRAENIGRTETLSAANNGQRLLWEHGVREGVLGPAQEREWLTAEDDRVEEDCRSMDHRKAIIGQPFSSPWGQIQSPPGHPRCRCCTVLVVG